MHVVIALDLNLPNILTHQSQSVHCHNIWSSVEMQTVEGIVVDVGWYRTTIRSFEREIYNIPNSVFSRNVVLNVTRKQREWRFFEFIGEMIATSITLQPERGKKAFT